jgi:hypothetical protein
MFHKLFSDLYMLIELNQQEGKRFVDDRCVLVSVLTEMMQEFEH